MSGAALSVSHDSLTKRRHRSHGASGIVAAMPPAVVRSSRSDERARRDPQRAWGPWAAWLALAVAWFAPLGHRALVNPDEGRYATIALGMLRSGDWITPHLNGFLYFEKPPFGYWMSAAAMGLLGVGEFAARLWPAACGFATAALVAFTARRMWGEPTGSFAGASAAGCLWIVANAHFLSLDMGLTLFLTLALCAFLLAQRDDALARHQRRWMLAAWAAMAGAVLTKGLVGVLIPGATLLLYCAWARTLAPMRRMHWLAGLAVFIALAAPWFVVVSLRNPGFADFFFVHEHFQRYLTNQARRPGAVWYFVPLLLAGFLPWTTMLPSLARFGAAREPQRTFQPRRFLLVYAAFVFVFFSASRSKLPSYILPMFPALALLAGAWLAKADPRRLRIHLLAPAVAGIAVMAVAPLLARFATHDTPPEVLEAMAPGFAAAGALVLGAATLAYRSFGQARALAGVVVLAAGTVLATLAALDGHDEHASIKSSRDVGAVLRPLLSADASVFSVAMYDQTLPFYLDRNVTLVAWTDEFAFGQSRDPGRWIPTVAEFAQRWQALDDGAAMMKPETWSSLSASGLPMHVVFRDARRVVVLRRAADSSAL